MRLSNRFRVFGVVFLAEAALIPAPTWLTDFSLVMAALSAAAMFYGRHLERRMEELSTKGDQAQEAGT